MSERPGTRSGRIIGAESFYDPKGEWVHKLPQDACDTELEDFGKFITKLSDRFPDTETLHDAALATLRIRRSYLQNFYPRLFEQGLRDYEYTPSITLPSDVIKKMMETFLSQLDLPEDEWSDDEWLTDEQKEQFWTKLFVDFDIPEGVFPKDEKALDNIFDRYRPSITPHMPEDPSKG